MSDVSEEGVVFTAGVSSAVLEGDDAIGHVLLLDVDGSDEITVWRAVESMDGVAAVFESSPGSFHIWQLSVRPWEESILEGLSWGIADSEHVAQSYRRGRYVLRSASKVRDDGSRYKAAPTLLGVSVGDVSEAEVSRPHLALLEELAEEVDVDLPEREELELVGDSDGLVVDRYMTLEDSTKALLRGDSE